MITFDHILKSGCGNYCSSNVPTMRWLSKALVVSSLESELRAKIERGGSDPLIWSASLGCLLLSTLAKENAYVAPALVFLYELVIRGEDPQRAAPWLRTLPFAGVILARILFVKYVVGFGFGHVVAVTKGQSRGCRQDHAESPAPLRRSSQQRPSGVEALCRLRTTERRALSRNGTPRIV